MDASATTGKFTTANTPSVTSIAAEYEECIQMKNDRRPFPFFVGIDILNPDLEKDKI
jgi:hypothetical protein